MCEFCINKTGKVLKWEEITRFIHGDLGVRAHMDSGIILYVDQLTASGYFSINYCPICGRRVSKEADPEPIPVQKVLEDMYNPDGGLVSMAARDYYYQNYASEEERKNMDREDKIQTAVAIIFMIAFWVAVGFVLVLSFIKT